MSFNCNQTLSAADLSTLNCLTIYYLVITMMTAFFLLFILNSCASYICVCVGGGGWLQEIKLLMDKFSQVKCTGLISKAHGIAGRLEKQPSRGHDWGAWGAREQQLWEWLLGRNMWAQLLGSAYPPPSLQSCTEVQSLAELRTCGLLLAGGGDEK